MCGICEFLGDTVKREQVIKRMMRVIWYRGPDWNEAGFEAVG
jgi:asparagine synthetase B (glutamine-hydrolysing)